MSIAVKLDIEAILHLENRLTAVHAADDSQLELHYSDGTDYRLNMQPYMRVGTPAAALGDPLIFESVRLARQGRAVEFEGGIDFCADALRLDAELQLHGLTRDDLKD